MSLGIKVFRLRFATANKTVEEVKADYNVGMPSNEMLQAITEAYRALDGLEIIGGDFSYSPDTYSLMSWGDDADEKVKEFIWLQEQDPTFGQYHNDRERFDKDWAADEYEPAGSLHFNKSDLEVIERILTKDCKITILNSIPVHTYEIEDGQISSVLCLNSIDNCAKIMELGFTNEQINDFLTSGGFIEMMRFASDIAESVVLSDGKITSWKLEAA